MSAQQERNFDGNGVSRTIDLACEAGPALVMFHIGLSFPGFDGQAIHRAGLDADVTAADALLFVYDHRYIENACCLTVRRFGRSLGGGEFRLELQFPGNDLLL